MTKQIKTVIVYAREDNDAGRYDVVEENHAFALDYLNEKYLRFIKPRNENELALNTLDILVAELDIVIATEVVSIAVAEDEENETGTQTISFETASKLGFEIK